MTQLRQLLLMGVLCALSTATRDAIVAPLHMTIDTPVWMTRLPEQVHLSYAQDSSSMTVMWVTNRDDYHGQDTSNATKHGQGMPASNVWLQPLGAGPIDVRGPPQASGQSWVFTDGGSLKRESQYHMTTLMGLSPGTTFQYVVGDRYFGTSQVLWFRTAPEEPRTARYLVFGDQGFYNAASLPEMVAEVQALRVDAVLSVGDYAYDFAFENGTLGDKYMRAVEGFAAHVPFMVAMGNHEAAYGFSHYTERFRGMPAKNGTVWSGAGLASNNWFYSWSVGLAHFVVISTEIYFGSDWLPDRNGDLISRQLEWLRADLGALDRASTPWIVLMGHRPMYCSTDGDCDAAATTVRESLEPVLLEFGVDLYLCGHQHNYERMFDLRNFSTTRSTVDPPSTTHVLTGSAGTDDAPWERKEFLRPKPEWSAVRSRSFGYSVMEIHNATHLRWQQVQTDPYWAGFDSVGELIDDFWLIQHSHKH